MTPGTRHWRSTPTTVPLVVTWARARASAQAHGMENGWDGGARPQRIPHFDLSAARVYFSQSAHAIAGVT